MIFIQFLRNSLEIILNRILYYDSSLKEIRSRLYGRVLQIKFDELSIPITLLFSTSKVDVLMNWKSYSDCIVKMRLSLFPILYNHKQLSRMIYRDELEIVGDLQVIQNFSMLISIVHSDLPNYISPWVGDILAYKLSSFIQRFFRRFKNNLLRKQFKLAEILIEEWKIALNSLEFNWHSEGIQELDRHLFQIEKRLKKMEEK